MKLHLHLMGEAPPSNYFDEEEICRLSKDNKQISKLIIKVHLCFVQFLIECFVTNAYKLCILNLLKICFLSRAFYTLAKVHYLVLNLFFF